MGALLARRQHNPPIFDIGVQRITCPNIKLAAKRAWKNHLPLGGNLGLHGKTILPRPRLSLISVIQRNEGIVIPITESIEMVAYRWMCLSIGF
jgi:hypothetical protein